MRKSIVCVVFVFAIIAMVTCMAYAEPAVLIKDDLCVVIDGNGNFVLSQDNMNIITLSQAGVIVAQCRAKDLANDTGEAVHYDFESTGLVCGVISLTGFELTEDWESTVSSAGNVTLTCRYKTP